MNSTLSTRDLISLGFMTFALFLGAGNIIFPPLVGQLAGNTSWSAALGFLLTGVGLPLLTVVALARIGGGLNAVTQPIGKIAGTIFGTLIYLTIGPLFATPRTATVSYSIGFVPFLGESELALAVYSFIFFLIVMLIALYPGRLLDTVGKLITPILIAGLAALAFAAIFWPAGDVSLPSGPYVKHAFAEGFTQGYQTMDALAALVFGIVIIKAISDKGITETKLLTRYTIIAGFIASIGLAVVYVSLIWLGASSGILAPDASTGAPILSAFVSHIFGSMGNVLLALIIVLACLTTAIGLISACGLYFSQLLNISYTKTVVALSLISMLIANQGLTQLIAIAVPALLTLYPIAISLVFLCLAMSCWRSAPRVFIPTLGVAALFGFMDGLRAAGLGDFLPNWLQELPGAQLGLGWILPVLVVLGLSATADRLLTSSN
ncbi:MAG TPA: branched-chain amino acid transport system II carrier protein [Alcaligenaceae bacterium]|nr:branched-chain amino acid transport system II carrier protein [Alcaligenaceae bacterium]